ncbi:hypothetical protein LEMLEM_LOCUS11219 [Lemmus lemmus]
MTMPEEWLEQKEALGLEGAWRALENQSKPCTWDLLSKRNYTPRS